MAEHTPQEIDQGIYLHQYPQLENRLDFLTIYTMIQTMSEDPKLAVFFNINGLDVLSSEVIEKAAEAPESDEEAKDEIIAVVGEPALGKKGAGSGVLYTVDKILRKNGIKGRRYYASNGDFVEQGMIERGIKPIEGFQKISDDDVRIGNLWVNATAAWFRDKKRKVGREKISDTMIMELLGIGDPDPDNEENNSFHPENNPHGYIKFNLGGNVVKNDADRVIAFITDVPLQNKNITRRVNFEQSKNPEDLDHDFDSDLGYEKLFLKMAPAVMIMIVRGVLDHNMKVTFPELEQVDLDDPDKRAVIMRKYLQHMFSNWDLTSRGVEMLITENKLMDENTNPKKRKYIERYVEKHAPPWKAIYEYKKRLYPEE